MLKRILKMFHRGKNLLLSNVCQLLYVIFIEGVIYITDSTDVRN